MKDYTLRSAILINIKFYFFRCIYIVGFPFLFLLVFVDWYVFVSIMFVRWIIKYDIN